MKSTQTFVYPYPNIYRVKKCEIWPRFSTPSPLKLSFYVALRTHLHPHPCRCICTYECGGVYLGRHCHVIDRTRAIECKFNIHFDTDLFWRRMSVGKCGDCSPHFLFRGMFSSRACLPPITQDTCTLYNERYPSGLGST